MTYLSVIRLTAITILSLLLSSCQESTHKMMYTFDGVPDRIWVGEDFWTVPLEDWRVKGGRLECSSSYQHATVSLLTHILTNMQGGFSLTVDMGLLDEGRNHGGAGISIGVLDDTDSDIRASVYFGTGLNLGVNTLGYAFLGNKVKELPENFDFSRFQIRIDAFRHAGQHALQMTLHGANGDEVTKLAADATLNAGGIIQLVNNFRTIDANDHGPTFWFDNIQIEGSIFTVLPENRFGPVFWTMHTLSRNVMKMTAQLPPVGEHENTQAHFQVLHTNGEWETLASESMDSDARTASFRVEDWDDTNESKYRVLFDYISASGEKLTAEYGGMIRKDPVDRPLRMGGLTCQFSSGFPYRPLVENLTLLAPDILYFSGDQIYESNGGYFVKRAPEEMAILSYLGKWYMFGWAFGELMRDIPTICTPDDHDVFHGNLWGEGGMPFDDQDIINRTNRINTGDLRGFAQTVRFVNMVNRTQCEHLPDPFDPTPIKQGMSVWYTSLNYGRISFAIVSDRIFKSAPERVSQWDGRNDHLTEPLPDASALEKPELQMLGERQKTFLENWIRDWHDVDVKVLLSQTVFANPATHHGRFDAYLFGDLDSGGWPKEARDRTIRTIRKAFAFHINGDQHLPSMLQYGIDNYSDAGWSFCTPAISIIYSRWFRPDEMDIPVIDRPAHNLPNTGKYKDSFGNLNYVYAIGNPDNFSRSPNRYDFEQNKSAGFGMIYFDQVSRDITTESWRFLADVLSPKPGDQHPGWPKTINQLDNDGRDRIAWLPVLSFPHSNKPVIEIINEDTNEMVYIVRATGNSFQPWVYVPGSYTIRAGHPETNRWHETTGVMATNIPGSNQLVIDL